MVPPLTLCAYMKKGPNLRWSLIQCSGGDEGDRTPDLLTASQALSQLSYTPEPLVLCGFRARNIDKYNKIIAKCQHLFFDFSNFFNRGFSLLFRPQDTVEDEACILKFIAAGGERHHPVLCPG